VWPSILSLQPDVTAKISISPQKKDVAALDKIHHWFFFRSVGFATIRQSSFSLFPDMEAVASELIKYEYLTSLSKLAIN
jgi:hypothetical protein